MKKTTNPALIIFGLEDNNKITTDWAFSSIFDNAPDQACELRVDRFGSFYWSDKNNIAWTKGVLDGKYSAISSDLIIAKRSNI
jgi:hypothetical protein